ncbi:DNA-binding protein [Amycolatopsis deserti]|uniref:DNA-binding protein n=1 Tax=Amycolatopsis deserti TaxID=185696 RepID=A0ABQ3JF09_9PSEU|nr:helix-turn-helix domain-containing protein [Amycolatopsis deserti]GHF19199.1 DNA-binding protein [Amycolatopsis deserti]
MTLGDLLAVLGTEQLEVELLLRDGTAVLSDVAILDPPDQPDRGQLVLAVGVDAGDPQAGEVVVDAAKAGAAAVVFRATDQPGPAALAREHGISLLRAKPGISWARLVTLVRTVLTATTADPGSARDRTSPSTVYGLADAIAVTVGGSVVLYDRAHRVVAYSVQGFAIDEVRRDTILGRRTPDQWIERFTTDNSAYETFRRPGEVVRVDGYENLSTRLRIAIRSEGEVLGEISVAEGEQPLGPEAEAALARAARLAVPHMLRHRLVEDADRASRMRLLRGLLYGDVSPPAELGLGGRTGLVVIGFAGADVPSGEGGSLAGERVLHLLSLQMNSIDPAVGVLPSGSVYYALVPAGEGDRVTRIVEPALRHIERLGITAHAAIGPWAAGPGDVPAARQVVDDLLHILRRPDWPATPTVVTAESRWPDLALLPVERALAGTAPCPQLRTLREHDELQKTDYIRTLRVFLDEFGSVSRTSERLVLHPNSVRHRLERLAEIAGLDLSDPAQRLAVMVQLRALPWAAWAP